MYARAARARRARARMARVPCSVGAMHASPDIRASQHHRCGRRMRRPYDIFIREHESGTKCGRPMGRPYDVYSASL